MNDITFHMIETNGVTLHTASADLKDDSFGGAAARVSGILVRLEEPDQTAGGCRISCCRA